MIQKLKNNNLSLNCKLSDRVVLAKEQFYLVFSKKECRTKSGATVSSTYKSQLKNQFPAAKITTSAKSLLKISNFWICVALLNLIYNPNIFFLLWFFKVFQSLCFFSLKQFCVIFIMKKIVFYKGVHTKEHV